MKYGDAMSSVRRAAPIAIRYSRLRSFEPPVGELRSAKALSCETAVDCGAGSTAGATDPRGFREVLVEGAFEEAGERTVDAHHRVPPVIRVLRVTEPLIADARSPCERHPAVHDEDLPVRAIVQFLERVPARLAEETHAHAGVTEPVGPLTRNPVGAHRVDDQVHLDAALRRTFQRRRELLADASPLIDVGLETDPPPRRRDRVEHWRKELIAIGEHLITVAGAGRGAQKRGEVGGNLGSSAP